MRTITLINDTDREARMANRRCVILKDPNPCVPDEHEDLIFHRGHGEIFGFKVTESYGYESEIFTATREKIAHEAPADGRIVSEWLNQIRDVEKLMWQKWVDGEIYGIVVQEWNDAERNWKCVECCYQLYGWDDVKEQLRTDSSFSEGVDVFCVDTESIGKVEDMLTKYLTVEVCA